MNLRILVAVLAALFVTSLVPSEAYAGRKVRLMYEPPDPAAELSTPVKVTFEDAREEKKGGNEPDLIAQERNNLGMPVGIFSGAQKTADPPEVVPLWLVDVLKAAGYDAQVAGTEGADSKALVAHIRLDALWGDGQPIMGVVRHSFSFAFTLQIKDRGGAVLWEQPYHASGKATTVMMRFDDPFEAGFVRAFDEASKAVLLSVGTDAFQEALPGGDVEAAAAAVEEVGEQSDGSGERKVGSTGVTAEDLPRGYESWDPEVYGWGGKLVAGGFVAGGVGLGLLIAGDQVSRANATNNLGVTGLAPVLSTLDSVAHIPYTKPKPTVESAVVGMVGEYMFQYGVHITAPSFGQTIPTLIAAASGADIQTTKAVMGFAGLSYLVPGIVHLSRFRLFPPVYDLMDADDSIDAWLHVPAGITTVAIGAVDIGLATASTIMGVLYASGAVKASPTEKGLFPVIGGRGGRLKNAEALRMVPTMGVGMDGRVTFGLVGTW